MIFEEDVQHMSKYLYIEILKLYKYMLYNRNE